MSSKERRQSLVQAILDVFLEHGVDNVRTKLIAERAGVAETLLYRHFTSKDAMLETAVYETVLSRLDDLRARVRDAVQGVPVEEGVRSFHCMLLGEMTHVAPLIAVAVFQEGAKAAEFYQHHLFPALQSVFAAADWVLNIAERTPEERRSFVAAVFGVHVGIALDAWLQDLVLDVPATASNLQALLTDQAR